MSEGQIRIRVGAAIDRSVEATFGAVESRAKKARSTILSDQQRAAKEGAKAEESGAKASAKAQDQFAKAAAKAAREMQKEHEKAAKGAAKAHEQAGKQIEKSFNDAGKALDKELARQEAAQSRSASKFANRTSQRAVRFLFPNPTGIFGEARRMGGEIMRGAGVDMSVGGSVGRAVEVNKLAGQLSNQGYRAGESGPAGQRVDTKQLESEARGVGKELSIDPAKLLEAQTKFVDITGNLDDSRKNMKGLAEIAVATGTDFTAMAEAAGNISRHLADTPDKAEKLAGIMRVLAGQGKVGSIEIKDFAAQMAKIAAIAPKFSGDVGENITKLTTIAQLSRSEGGSATAAQAATATARFSDTFTSGARLKKFQALGIDPYTDSGHTQLKDPFEIIRQSISKTKGSATALGELFKSVMSQRAVTALSNAYNQAGGGSKGMAAVNSQLAVFGKESAITKNEVTEDVAKYQGTDAAQAQKFQDTFDEVIAQMKNDLLPTLKELEPVVLKTAKAFAGLISWAAQNPGEAIVLAIVAAIARAGLESAFRGAIEKAIGNFNSGSRGGGLGGAVGGLVSGGGGYTGVRGAINSPLGGMLATGAAVAGVGAAVDQYSKLSDAVSGSGYKGGTLDAIWDVVSGHSDKVANVGKAATPEEYDAMMAKNLSKELRVRITNPNDIKQQAGEPPPGVDPGGRSPPP